MLEQSKFFNGNKKAIVYKTDEQFTVYMYLDDRIVQKRAFMNSQAAENLAEDFVMGETGGSQLLNENA